MEFEISRRAQGSSGNPSGALRNLGQPRGAQESLGEPNRALECLGGPVELDRVITLMVSIKKSIPIFEKKKNNYKNSFRYINSTYASLFFSELSTVSSEISEVYVSEELVEEDPELNSK